jgi:hypothetical protein
VDRRAGRGGGGAGRGLRRQRPARPLPAQRRGGAQRLSAGRGAWRFRLGMPGPVIASVFEVYGPDTGAVRAALAAAIAPATALALDVKARLVGGRPDCLS